MASVFLLFMILFSFIVSCGTLIKDFRARKEARKTITVTDYSEE